SMHFYGWLKGLKTGMYYLRSKPAVDAMKFTIDPKLLKEQQEQDRALRAMNPTIPINDIIENEEHTPPTFHSDNKRTSFEKPIVNAITFADDSMELLPQTDAERRAERERQKEQFE